MKRAAGLDGLSLARVAQHDDASAVRFGHLHQAFHDSGGHHTGLVDDQHRIRVQLEAVLLPCLKNGGDRSGLHAQLAQRLNLFAIGRHCLHGITGRLGRFLDLGQHMRLPGPSQALNTNEAVRRAEDQVGSCQLPRFEPPAGHGGVGSLGLQDRRHLVPSLALNLQDALFALAGDLRGVPGTCWNKFPTPDGSPNLFFGAFLCESTMYQDGHQFRSRLAGAFSVFRMTVQQCAKDKVALGQRELDGRFEVPQRDAHAVRSTQRGFQHLLAIHHGFPFGMVFYRPPQALVDNDRGRLWR
ncbi:hypothetical protein D9M68_559310 [compost metagenome]